MSRAQSNGTGGCDRFPEAPVTPRVIENRDRVRGALAAFMPGARITETVLVTEEPGDEQVFLHVSVPGLSRDQVMPRLREFERLRWNDLLADVGDDVCLISA